MRAEEDNGGKEKGGAEANQLANKSHVPKAASVE